MKRITLLTFIVFLIVGGLFLWQEHLPKYKLLTARNIPNNVSHTKFVESKQLASTSNKSRSISSTGNSYSEIVVDPNTNTQIVKTHLAAGKRLYNEQAMEEVSKPATIEYFNRE